MQERNVGRSGLQVSAVGVGCNNFGGRIDRAATRRVVHKALDLGITLFDTADAYGEMGASEELLGESLGARRKDIVLATKFGMALDRGSKQRTSARDLVGASRRYIMSAVEASLRRLKTDWIDLYQVHRPDPATPIEETLRALDDLVRQGKVRYIGCSNFAAWQLVEALWCARCNGLSAFTSFQDQYSLLVRGIERDLLPAGEAYNLGLLPYFPLASGLLSGKYKRAKMPEGARLTYSQRHSSRFLSERNWQIVDQLEAFCAERQRSMLELAFGWLLSKLAVASVIAGATAPEQLEQNVHATGWQLTPDELAEIDRITAPETKA